ncbi:DAP3-binding cell death enhancer 1-like isoform X1 [Coregonus clupeaformis]|uniref:DAP3-binding cell death enhancer 1-like isoform X1 n=1 Tax=Coregonus clupeaformis TaxID=59861 RepID=UPI001E1C40B6|nr:DAP3-binding cell death enhancer 1-like isoform X1 [Coregonus clupeaformis]
MWRVQGFVGRVLSRCHGNAPLRQSQNHHVEDEVINTSTLLSTGCHSPDSSSQKGEDGDKRRKKRTSQFCYAGLPRYTALDAVGWGEAAVLLMQICRRVHSQFSGSEPNPNQNPNTGRLAIQGTLQKFGNRFLLERLSRHYVLPRGRSVHCLPQSQQPQSQQPQSQQPQSQQAQSQQPQSQQAQEHSRPRSSYSSPDQFHEDHLTAGTEESSFSESSLPEDNHRTRDGEQPGQQNDQDALAGAAQNLQQVADSSGPVVLNIIGLESAQTGDYEAAFSCFLASARRGYCKAQFNTGVCYEKGRGVCKDKEKALDFYSQAATGGHSQAQYRCAKLLLNSRGQQSTQQDLDTAISLLQQAASAGLREAQVYLGSLFSQEPVRDGRKSVHYLKMAAESGDSEALLFLGQCYETGFGVSRCFRTAVGFYQRAAQAGNSQAKTLLAPPFGLEEDAVLRSIRSSQCFSVADHLRRPLSTLTSPVPPSSRPTLPHSWSTGSMGPPPMLSSLTPSSQRNAVRWTIGVG